MLEKENRLLDLGFMMTFTEILELRTLGLELHILCRTAREEKPCHTFLYGHAHSIFLPKLVHKTDGVSSP